MFGTNLSYIYISQNDVKTNYMAYINGPRKCSTSTDLKRMQPTEVEPTAPTDSVPDLYVDFEQVEIALGKKFHIGKDLPLQRKTPSSTIFR